MIYLLDLRRDEEGGPVVPGRLVQVAGRQPPLGTERDLLGERRVIFLVHGYNVSRSDGREGLLRLADQLAPVLDGALVAVLWPGDHFTRALSFPFEGKDADDSARELVRFLDRIGLTEIELSFVTHSLGARVALRAASRLLGSRRSIRQVCLMAAAIDDYSLSRAIDFRSSVLSAQRVAVLASRKDRVLELGYPAGAFLQVFLLKDRDRSGLALGFHGPRATGRESIPGQVLHLQIPDGRGASHGSYIPAAAITPEQTSAVAFATQVLQGGATPAYP